MEQARRTLREARARQHQVKMNRQYCRINQKDKPNEKTKPGDRTLKCFRCGGPHKIAQCPEKKSAESQNVVHEAPFVRFTEGMNQKSSEDLVAEALSAEQETEKHRGGHARRVWHR